MHQMRLAHAHSAIKKQRVVSLRRLLCNGPRRSVRKLIRFADDKRIKAVAQIQLMIAAFKVQLRLLHAGCCGSGWHWFFLRTDVLHFHVGSPKFVEHGFDDLAIGARQDLPEDRAGNLHEQVFTLRPIQPRGLKPCGVGVDADPGLHVLKKSLPGIRRSSHHKRKSHPVISTDVNKLWKARPFFSFFFLASGIVPVPERLAFPWRPAHGPSRIVGPSTRRYQTARDCRRLDRMEQAKSVRRDSPRCTCHAQLFHKHNFCATPSASAYFCGNLDKISASAHRFAQIPSKSP